MEIVRSFYDAWARDELPGPVKAVGDQVAVVVRYRVAAGSAGGGPG